MQTSSTQILSAITATNTVLAPSGTSIPADRSDILKIVQGVRHLAFNIELTDTGGADVDVKLHLKPRGGNWYEDTTAALLNLEAETNPDDTYLFEVTSPFIFEAAFIEIISVAGTFKLNATAIYDWGG